MKRVFDFTFAFLGLVLIAPLLIIVAALIKSGSEGPVFFRQQRVGRSFIPFYIYKFRTMDKNATQLGSAITVGEDPRITRIGRILRKFKVDELPQLLNVLKGEMSLVGPRPEVKKYVDMYHDEYEEILSIRPGITDLASVKHRNEADMLGTYEDPEAQYANMIIVDKINLAKKYCRSNNLAMDFTIIFKTFLAVLVR